MTQQLETVTLLVHDYDEAIQFFTQALRFTLLEDSPRSADKRWILVSPAAGRSARLLLAKAADAQQTACVGNQAGGRVFLFLHTDDFDGDYAHMLAHGVRFMETPRNEPHGRVVVFQDLYGNKWDLLQPAESSK